MTFGKLLLGTLALFSMRAAEAREASLQSFPSVDTMIGTYRQNVASEARNGLVSVEVPLAVNPGILNSVGRPSRPWNLANAAIDAPVWDDTLCFNSGYTPTWWLGPEVEARRAIHYEAMAQVACEYSIPLGLLDALIAQESGYQTFAVSKAGAIGIMQIMPGTARNLELRNPWDALANMRAGARYLRRQLARFGRVDLALAAYNAGPERRSLALGSIPAIPETRNYVQAITTNWVRLTKLESSNSTVAVRAMAANIAVRASGYREVSLVTYDGTNAANPI